MILLQASIGLGLIVLLAFAVTVAFGVPICVNVMMRKKLNTIKANNGQMNLIAKIGYFIFSVLVGLIISSATFILLICLISIFVGPIYT